jgi:hypothetical protein
MFPMRPGLVVRRTKGNYVTPAVPVVPQRRRMNEMDDLKYVYRWDRMGRKGERCAVPVRGTMNSCLVVFADGFSMVTSRNAIRKGDAS